MSIRRTAVVGLAMALALALGLGSLAQAAKTEAKLTNGSARKPHIHLHTKSHTHKGVTTFRLKLEGEHFVAGSAVAITVPTLPAPALTIPAVNAKGKLKVELDLTQAQFDAFVVGGTATVTVNGVPYLGTLKKD